jgi:malonyl-CoA decarboxylase
MEFFLMFERFIRGRSLETAKKTALHLLSDKGEANAQHVAAKLLETFYFLDRAEQLSFFEFMSVNFNPNPAAVLAAAQRYADHPDHASLSHLFLTVEPPRQELFRRMNRAIGGTHAIVQLRERLLGHLKAHPELKGVDSDIQHVFSSWFNPGFLELHEITWSSPAILLEKIIKHESVHAIDGWDDLRRRLQPDRRCFAFFHPQLPGEPLIFVEVALVPGIAREVGPLLDKKALPLEAKKFKTAIFYSISNCQPGLKGVSLGNFLIKRVAEKIQKEIPSVKTFCTLSPIPGFTKWLDSGVKAEKFDLSPAKRAKVEDSFKLLRAKGQPWAKTLSAGWSSLAVSEEEKAALIRLCFIYLSQGTCTREGDAVAKFHLSNGAQLYNINWAADLSKKGVAQSSSLMVNYLYELDDIENNHEAFLNKTVVYAKSLEKLV